MKFKYNFLAISLLGAMAVSCEPMEDIYDEIDAEETVITKSEDEYVLTKADYESISNAAKKAATNKDEERAADDVKKQLALNEIVSADKYVPSVLAKVYNTWGKGSTVGVTYTNRLPYDKESKLNHLKGIVATNISSSDYDQLWAEDGFEGANYFAPAHPAAKNLPVILAGKFADARTSDKVVVDYKVANANPKVEAGADLLSEDFASVENKQPIQIEGWTTLQLAGDRNWKGKVFYERSFVEIGAYKANGDQQAAMITPAVEITDANASLTFDLTYGHYNGDCLKVYVGENFDGAIFDASKWTELTSSFKFPAGDPNGYTDLANVGNASLASFKGKKVYFAFVYTANGSGVTTTIQLDNVKVSSTKITHAYAQKYTTMYEFNGTAWEEFKEDDVIVLTPADYDSMGAPGKHDNFSDSQKAANYLPQFLALNFPYAQNNDVKCIVYKFYKSGETKVYVDEYKFDGTWNFVPRTQFETRVKESFLHNGKQWLFDPTVNYAMDKVDYDYLVSWVKENKPAYMDAKYDNTEYWFGGSAHYANFNVQLIKRRSNDPENLIPADDKAAKEYLDGKIAEGVKMVLSHNNPNAPTQMSGLDLYFKISCKVYDGASNFKYTFKFKSLGNGKFEQEGQFTKEDW